MLTLVYQVHVIECVPCIGLVANRQATVRFHFVLKKKKKKRSSHQTSLGMQCAALHGGGLVETRRWRLSARKRKAEALGLARHNKKTQKKGRKIEKRREGQRRETKSIPPPLKSLTRRWKPHKIINISRMHAAHYLHSCIQ